MQYEAQEFKKVRSLERGTYDGCTFMDCVFTPADLSEILFLDCVFQSCSFSMANIDNVT